MGDSHASARPFRIIAGITAVTAALFTFLVALPSERGLDPLLLLIIWSVPLITAAAALRRRRRTTIGPARPPGLTRKALPVAAPPRKRSRKRRR